MTSKPRPSAKRNRYRVVENDSNTAGVFYYTIEDELGHKMKHTSVDIMIRGDSDKAAKSEARRICRLLNTAAQKKET